MIIQKLYEQVHLRILSWKSLETHSTETSTVKLFAWLEKVLTMHLEVDKHTAVTKVLRT